MGETLHVPAYSEMEVMANLVQPEASGMWIMEGDVTPPFPTCQPRCRDSSSANELR